MVEHASIAANMHPSDGNVRPIGTVISFASTPDVYTFHFVISSSVETSKQAKVGMYVCTGEDGGFVIGQVVNLIKINEYFLNASTFKESRPQVSFSSIFPTDQWEYVLAEVKVMGYYPALDGKQGFGGTVEKSITPVSPGSSVQAMGHSMLEKFLGFNPVSGLHLGTMEVDGLPVKVDLAKLFQKHLAVLAMSGAGKSYLVSVLLEELIKARGPMPPVVIVDTHGEYTAMFNASGVKKRFPGARVEVVGGSFIQVGTPFLSGGSFFNYMPNMSPVQGRDLMRVFNELRQARKKFDLHDLVSALQADDKLGKKTKDALEGWLYQLEQYGMFSTTEHPRVDEIMKPGTIVVLDLSGLTSSKQKQIIVDYFASRAFYLRKSRSIPPFVLVIEEAHQFVPQAAAELAVARHTIETIAREGRKFFASLCLISQRPVNLNTTVLSQCNTQIILRVSNPYDLDHIRSSSEKITSEALKMISSLPVGSALIVGSAVNTPAFFKVRPREFLVDGKEGGLMEEIAAFSPPK
ncbi:MAG: ATP-binding protein [Candidatus Lokiarchaeota archaeon]|nr:ATP-binding protein [Candidatus Lokiarchaeota archaeon]